MEKEKLDCFLQLVSRICSDLDKGDYHSASMRSHIAKMYLDGENIPDKDKGVRKCVVSIDKSCLYAMMYKADKIGEKSVDVVFEDIDSFGVVAYTEDDVFGKKRKYFIGKGENMKNNNN